MLPIDDRLRAVARGQFSRLAQYEIEVENPLRPKEIQARIRAGETVEEIADAAGIPVERVRWFEGPVLAERGYIAEQAHRASVRRQGDSAPGPRLGEVVAERLTELGADPADAQWDSRKHGDGSWQVQLAFRAGGRLHIAEWLFDPRRRHVSPADDNAERLSLPEAELRLPTGGSLGAAKVTPIRPRPDRREAAPQHQPVAEQVEEPARAAAQAASPSSFVPPRPPVGRPPAPAVPHPNGGSRPMAPDDQRSGAAPAFTDRPGSSGRGAAGQGTDRRAAEEPTGTPAQSPAGESPAGQRAARARPAASTASPTSEQPNRERVTAGHASTERAAAADTSPERSAGARAPGPGKPGPGKPGPGKPGPGKPATRAGARAPEAAEAPADQASGPEAAEAPADQAPPPVAPLTGRGARPSPRPSPRRSQRPTGTRKTTPTGTRKTTPTGTRKTTPTGTRTRPRPVGAARRPPDHADGGRRSPRGTRSCSATRASLTRTNARTGDRPRAPFAHVGSGTGSCRASRGVKLPVATEGQG